MPFEPRGKNPRKTGLHRTALFIKTSWLILAGCGLKIGERPYLPADRLYYDGETSDPVCRDLNYGDLFRDFFTKPVFPSPEKSETTLFCLEETILRYENLVRGAHEDYLTKSELINILNTPLIKKDRENLIDTITREKNFDKFINSKNIILSLIERAQDKKLRDKAEKRGPEVVDLGQNCTAMGEVSSEDSIALHKREVDIFLDFLQNLRGRLIEFHSSSNRISEWIADYFESDELLRRFQELFPEEDIDSVLSQLIRKNQKQVDPDLLRQFFLHQVRRNRLGGTTRSQGANSGQETQGADPKRGPWPPGEDQGGNVFFGSSSLYAYLKERPATALSIPEVRRVVLGDILTEEWSKILPGFSGYLKERESALEQKEESSSWWGEWIDRESPAKKERDDVLDSLYEMTAVSRGLSPHTGPHLTELDVRYILFGAHFTEIILDVYDLNDNSLLEKTELADFYCLFGNVLALTQEEEETEPENWMEEWKRSFKHPEKIFSYILKYQETPSEGDLRFIWDSLFSPDEDITLSRGAVVRLVSTALSQIFTKDTENEAQSKPSVTDPPQSKPPDEQAKSKVQGKPIR